MCGTVIEGANNAFCVECDDGVTRRCTIKGKKIKSAKEYYNPIAPGDKVCVACDKLDNGKGQITNMLPRKNAFMRWNIKGKAPQLLGANIDRILLVTTPCEPPFNPCFIDKELLEAEHEDIIPIIICNKCDLASYSSSDFSCRLSVWKSLGYTVLSVSAKTGEGIPDLARLIENKTCALAGMSGAGKSSIINALAGRRTQKTGDMSRKYGTGSHTTSAGILLHLCLNGVPSSVIDTPGVRNFMLYGIQDSEAALYFREFRPYIGKCAFGLSCTHTNERGCKITEAVASGAISYARYDSWKRIYKELTLHALQ